MSERLPPGATISRYRILSYIAAGGMGEVYLAQDTQLGRRVALKLLPERFNDGAERLRRFEQEARAASALNHPNIVTIHEIGEHGSLRFMVLEFVEGLTLRARMAQSRMELPAILDIAIQAASALAAAHAAGIVHRDLKPDNLMLRADGLVKVLDFGLAKLAGAPAADAATQTQEHPATQAGLVLGTVRYMSPEQARGLPVDARTDIYSIGVLLYEMVAGRHPFESASSADLIAAILMAQPPPLRTYAPETPDELQRIVSKALAKDREARYQTTRDLEVDLRNLQGAVRTASSLPQSAQGEAGATQARSAAGRLRKYAAPLLGTLILAVLAAALYWAVAARGVPAIESLAVMPFANASGDPNAEYLSDGITDTLINSLSQLPKLKVMSHNSVFRYKGRDTDAEAVGKQLGVRAVLVGNIVKHDGALSISVELVDVRDNSHLWGERYSRSVSDLPAMQTEIARDISDKLRLKLTGEDRKRLARSTTENVEAYDLYLKGRYYLNTLTEEGGRKALEYFQRAVSADPGYAPAYAGLAECYTGMVNLGTTFVLPPKEAFVAARTAARRAVELDDSLAEAHTSLGLIAMTFEWNWGEAEREFRRAIALNPNYVVAHHYYSHFLICTERLEDSLTESRLGLALDPLDTGMNVHLGFQYFNERRYQEAAAQLEKTLNLNPGSESAHGILGLVYEQMGRYDEAVAELRKDMELGGTDSRGNIAHVYAISGRTAEARRILDELQRESRQKNISPYNIAVIYDGLRETDQAFAALDKAYEQRDGNLVNLKVDPEFASVRRDPRFPELLRRIGLAP